MSPESASGEFPMRRAGAAKPPPSVGFDAFRRGTPTPRIPGRPPSVLRPRCDRGSHWWCTREGDARDRREGRMYKHLLVHVDGGEKAGGRIDLAVKLADRFGARLTALFAQDDDWRPKAGGRRPSR